MACIRLLTLSVLFISCFIQLTPCRGEKRSRRLEQPKSLAYILQLDKKSKVRKKAVTRLKKCDRDWVVMDVSFDGSSEGKWLKEEVETIRKGKAGRKVLAYLSIGEAEDYRSYWKKSWDANRDGKPDKGAPAFLHNENPDWEGNYKVRYWDKEWQRIILNCLNDIVAQGFDGVYLDIVDAFETFEYDPKSRDWIDNRINPKTGNTFRDDMVQWVREIAIRARRSRPGFLVVPQNGAQLLEKKEYIDIIDAVGIEDLFTDGDKLNKKKDVKYTLKFLRQMQKAKKTVMVIEYGRRKKARNRSVKGAKQNGFLLLITDRELTSSGEGLSPGGKVYK